MSDQVTFAQAVMVCFQTPELMTEYRRLTGATIGKDDRSAIERLIDEAAGHDPWESEYAPFFEFVRDVVWMPVAVALAGERDV